LAAAVRHVAVFEGDGAGYDVASFELDGSERFVEVKTMSDTLGVLVEYRGYPGVPNPGFKFTFFIALIFGVICGLMKI
jgi:hypothetical protein